MLDPGRELAKAVKHFWSTRANQQARQGSASGVKDAGNRSAVTGGKHADGFVQLIERIVRDAGMHGASIHTAAKTARTLPGYFRPTKEWDVVVRSGNDLVAVVEVKSQVGSFGNKDNAKRLADRLESADLDDVDIQRARVGGGKVWRVRIGPLAGREAADRIAARVRALGLGQPTVVAE